MAFRTLISGVVLGLVLSIGGPAAGMQLGSLSSPLNDPEHECVEPVPETVSVTGVTDDGKEITVETLVLLDGVPKAIAEQSIDLANDSYSRLAMRIVPTYRRATFEDDGAEAGMDDEVGPTGDTYRMIEDAKTLVGGERPEGIDVVLTLTSKDLFAMDGAERAYSIAGQADCIGGIRYDDHSFAVAEVITPYTESLGDRFRGLVTAHEIGHLFGAHHHYGNCVEGDELGNPCTIMWTVAIQLVSRDFGTLEAVTVRGHAYDFAR